MALSDTAEYWQDVKSRRNKHIFTHIKGVECGHFHAAHSNELNDIDCYACKKLIEADEALKKRLEANNGNAVRKWENKKKKKRGYKLETTIKFGKFNGKKTIKELIDGERSYFNWLQDKILLHPEVDEYLVVKI